MSRCWRIGMNGNLDQVRKALQGIAGVPLAPKIEAAHEWYLVMARCNRELDTVDSFRRRGVASYWPSYETLVTTSEKVNGRYVRKMRRTGILPGYVFSLAEGHDIVTLLQRIVGAFDIARSFSGNP